MTLARRFPTLRRLASLGLALLLVGTQLLIFNVGFLIATGNLLGHKDPKVARDGQSAAGLNHVPLLQAEHLRLTYRAEFNDQNTPILTANTSDAVLDLGIRDRNSLNSDDFAAD